jgi:hypothetical protein
VYDHEAPLLSAGEANAPLSATTWCVFVSALCQTTVSPWSTVIDEGVKPFFVTCTVFVAAAHAAAAAIAASPATGSSSSRRLIPVPPRFRALSPEEVLPHHGKLDVRDA